MFTVIRIILVAVLVLIFVGCVAKAIMHAKAAGENLKEMLGKKSDSDKVENDP